MHDCDIFLIHNILVLKSKVNENMNMEKRQNDGKSPLFTSSTIPPV